jgi:hypothetical protein
MQRLAVVLNLAAFALVAPQLIGLRRLHALLARLSSVVRSKHIATRRVSVPISLFVAGALIVTVFFVRLVWFGAPGLVAVVGGVAIYVLLSTVGFLVLMALSVDLRGRSFYGLFSDTELLAGCMGGFAVFGFVVVVAALVVLVTSPLVAIPLGVASWLLFRVVTSLEARGALARYGVRAGVACLSQGASRSLPPSMPRLRAEVRPAVAGGPASGVADERTGGQMRATSTIKAPAVETCN